MHEQHLVSSDVPDSASQSSTPKKVHMAVVDGEEAGGETKRLHIVQEEEEAEGKVGGGNIQKRLMFAVKKGNVEAFRELIKQGASVKVMDAYVPQEKEQKSVSLWSWLTCSAEKEEQDPAPAITEDYPLHVAASEGNVGLIEAIVDLGADLEAKNRMGSTALHRAVSAGQLVAAEKLIDLGASIDTTNNIGNTALHVAVFCGHKKIVQLLLSNGAYAQLHTPNKLAYTPLSYAKGRNIIAQMLKEYEPGDAESKQKTQHNIHNIHNIHNETHIKQLPSLSAFNIQSSRESSVLPPVPRLVDSDGPSDPPSDPELPELTTSSNSQDITYIHT